MDKNGRRVSIFFRLDFRSKMYWNVFGGWAASQVPLGKLASCHLGKLTGRHRRKLMGRRLMVSSQTIAPNTATAVQQQRQRKSSAVRFSDHYHVFTFWVKTKSMFVCRGCESRWILCRSSCVRRCYEDQLHLGVLSLGTSCNEKQRTAGQNRVK